MAKVVLDIPEEFIGIVDCFRGTLDSLKGMKDRAGGGKAIDYAKVEQDISNKCRKIELEAHRVILQALDIDVPAIVVGGIRYNRVGRCEAPYHTLAGSVSIERSLYRKAGTRGGNPDAKVVDPVSLRTGVVGDGWLPQTARVMSHEMQKGTSREAVATASEYGFLPYSRSSFETVAHLVGALAVAEHQDIEDTLIDAYEMPPQARSVSVSLDRVSVPMEEPKKRTAGRPRKGAPKNPIERNFRMAYCATVTIADQQGEALHTIRYGTMPNGDIIGLRDRLVADVATLHSRRRDLKIQLLCDGAPEMWNLLEAGFTKERFGCEIFRLVDLYHLTEKLAAATRIIEPTSNALSRKWKMNLINKKGAATEILNDLIASGLDKGPGQKDPVHEAITYLQSHHENADRMDYALARKLGLPLGSGNVEATCKSLFELRLKRCGARWKNETGQHIVQLRAFALSDRWGSAVELTLAPLRKAVRIAA